MEAHDGLADLNSEVKAFSPYIYDLDIQEMESSVNWFSVLEKLVNLESLSLTLGRKKAGMDYKRQLIGMKMQEAEDISAALPKLKNLKVLNLKGNQIDDDIVKILIDGIGQNQSIHTVNFAHNKITNIGARRITKGICKATSQPQINTLLRPTLSERRPETKFIAPLTRPKLTTKAKSEAMDP